MISVIVPVYNAEKHLRNCIDSIINQTYKNLEIILVDDGSTDNSSKILDEYKKTDSRIKVISKENGGVSSARNEGLKIATGEYVGFIDSDDYIDEEMFSVLRSTIQDGELAICTMKRFTDCSNCCQSENSIQNEYSVLDSSQLFTAMLNDKKVYGYLCNKLFKRKFISNLLNENIHFGEDFLFCAEYATRVKKAHFIDKALYYYRQDNVDSITNTSIEYNSKALTILKAQIEIEKIYLKYAPNEVNNLVSITLETALDLLGKYKYNKVNKKEEYDVIMELINKYYRQVVSSFSIKKRTRYFFRKNAPLLYFKHKYRGILKK